MKRVNDRERSVASILALMDSFQYDAFISHASEDKEEFVEPLARELKRWGLQVWFDKFSLQVGDSLRDSIETGLAQSKYGVVVFSPKFVDKNWPKAELNGLWSREMSGKKVILPIWHKITSEQMKSILPMQSDKVALRSEAGVPQVARALIQVIRPELLTVDLRKSMAFDADSSFIQTARERFPGYEFAVHTEPIGPPSSTGQTPSSPKLSQRIDVRISNPSAIKQKPRLSISFSKEGAKKAAELHRTGRPQEWNYGEFKSLTSTIPLMPEIGAGSRLIIRQMPSKDPLGYFRIEIGSTDQLVFPIMEMRRIRAGSEQGELGFSHKLEAISFSLSLDKQDLVSGYGTAGFALSSTFEGHTFRECQKAIDAIDRIGKGEPLQFINIAQNSVSFRGPARDSSWKEDAFPRELRRLVKLGAQIERAFGIHVEFPERFSEEDGQSLFYLDCLLNGEVFADGLTTTYMIAKACDDEMRSIQRQLLLGHEMWQFLEITNFPGFFLFGKQILCKPWGIHGPVTIVDGAAPTIEEFDAALPGTEFEVTVKARPPVKLRWKPEESNLNRG